MQLIAEAWDVMRRGLELPAAATADVWAQWNAGPLESFLVELTAQVCRAVDPETGQALVDVVLDKAGQKGTGRWTAQVALELAVPVPTIAAAVDARVLSSLKAERVAAAPRLTGPVAVIDADDRAAVLRDLHDALFAARVCAYAQGLALIGSASREYGWGVHLSEICRIWTAGCISRARLLDDARAALQNDRELPNLLLADGIRERVGAAQGGWRRSVARASAAGIPLPAHATALSYYDAYRTPRLPQSLTQAQRDAFGAHTFERIDRDGSHHVEWV
jgi:6-phosphogluconate dehydrogenase